MRPSDDMILARDSTGRHGGRKSQPKVAEVLREQKQARKQVPTLQTRTAMPATKGRVHAGTPNTEI